MTLPELLEQIAKTGCPTYSWYYDIRQMQNVTADDCKFPAIYMEEYYADRILRNGFTRSREVTFELHFLQLVDMQGVAIEREQVREELRTYGVIPFIDAFNAYALENGLKEVEEWQCNPEPPLFDANATGVLLRFTATIPTWFVPPTPPAPEPTPDPEPETEIENENEEVQTDD